MAKHSIIPISFKDYNEYVDRMNELSDEGYTLISMIRVYEDSPKPGVTTHDWVCIQKPPLVIFGGKDID